MIVIRGHYNIKKQPNGCVATIGNFDGIHLGHQSVIGHLTEKAQEMKLASVLITFERLPQEFFQPDCKVPRLTRFREKVNILRRFSIDYLLLLRFNQHFSNLSAAEFIQKILIEKLNIRYLVVGDDFRFGHDRKGNFELLIAAGKQHGFNVINMHTFTIEHERVSSTRIRQALQQGDMSQAEKLLGRPYRIDGRVGYGDQLGRTIGFPTANIKLLRKRCALSGVYIVEMFGIDDEPIRGVANIGSRPTVKNAHEFRLEVHLFNFSKDIYGQYVHVDILKKVRDELKFDSFEMLKQQIALDVQQAKAYFQLN